MLNEILKGMNTMPNGFRHRVTRGSVEVALPECAKIPYRGRIWTANDFETRKNALVQQLGYQRSLLEELREKENQLAEEMADTKWHVALERSVEKQQIERAAKRAAKKQTAKQRGKR